MKTRLFATLLAVVLVAAAAPASFGAGAQRQRVESDDFPERDEFTQSYELAPGARVEVRGINGTVDVETGSGSTAEVHIIRSARNRDDLNYRKITVEATANSLVVRGDRDQEGWRRDHSVRQRVMLTLPRQVDLNVNGINGRTTVGEIEGPVRLSGINGQVSVAQAVGYSDISGINGRVAVTISRLGERGIHVSGVNGGVELRFVDEVNADVDVTGINGTVHADVPNAVLQGKIDRQNFHAKIGSGGSPIKVTGVNGHVRLVRAGAAG
jgi:hypothetical protein